jgi:hypothetical protein
MFPEWYYGVQIEVCVACVCGVCGRICLSSLNLFIFWFSLAWGIYSQQTMRLLLWVYDQSYTHKNGHLLSNMVIHHFLWSLKFFRFFCGHIQYLMVIDFFVAKVFFPLVVNSYILWSLKKILFVKFYMTTYLHKWPLWKKLFIYKILCDHLFL